MIDKQKLNKIDSNKLIEKFNTKSAVIRHLNNEGYSRSEIAHILDIRYQHVRNVLITPLKSKNHS